MEDKKLDVARAWKDEDYRESLSDHERASLPSNPVGNVELSDGEMDVVAGGVIEEQDQTGTDVAAACYCVITKTADSGDGTCYCRCSSGAGTAV